MIRVFAGSNSYLINSYVNQIKFDFIAQSGDMSVEEIDCEEIGIDILINALQSTPLFTDKKLVLARGIAQNKKLSEQIKHIFEVAKTTNDLIIIEINLDKRGAYYKFLKKNSNFTECNELNEDQLANWLVEEAKTLKANISRQNARYLTNRVGLNQRILYSELRKLVDFNQNITRDSIDELTSEKPQSSIFNLIDAAFTGNSKKTLKMYDEQKAQGAAPQSIFGMLIWQANIVASVACAGNMSGEELAKITGIKPFSIAKATNIYRRIGKKGVEDLLNSLIVADKQMKTQYTDPDEVLKNLLTTIF